MDPRHVRQVAAAEVPADGFLLDVREPDEWIEGHAPQAVHIPVSDFLTHLQRVPRDREVFVICRVGSRSLTVASWLSAHGYDAVDVVGGMVAWHAAGRPMVSETGWPPRVG